jgi:hypothetical protein
LLIYDAAKAAVCYVGVAVYHEGMKIRRRPKLEGAKFTRGAKRNVRMLTSAKHSHQGDAWAQIDDIALGRLRSLARTSNKTDSTMPKYVFHTAQIFEDEAGLP